MIQAEPVPALAPFLKQQVRPSSFDLPINQCDCALFPMLPTTATFPAFNSPKLFKYKRNKVIYNFTKKAIL